MAGGRKSLFGFLGFKRVHHKTKDTKKRAEAETGTRHPGSTGGRNYIDRKAEDFIEKVRRQRDSPEQRGATAELPIKRGTMVEVPIKRGTKVELPIMPGTMVELPIM